MITVESLQKTYGAQVAVKDISLSVDPGTIVGFVGPNGSGKSTTLRMIAGLEKPDSGRCLIDGVQAGHLESPWSKMGTLLDRQGVNGELTALRALLALGAAYNVPQSQLDKTLDMVGLTHAGSRKVKTFSLGMKQRLNLALALIAHPDYLILDEPMNGLDPDGIIWLREFFQRYRDEGGGILLSSHTLAEVEAIADEVVVIKGGSTIWSGNMADFRAQQGSVVSTTDNKRLRVVLTDNGYKHSIDCDGVIHVADADPKVLGKLLHAKDFVVTHLSQSRSSLEQLYLSLNESN